MALVTDIVIPRRGTRRRVLWVDGAEYRATSAAVLDELDIRVGHVEPLESLEAALSAAERQFARARALRVLAYRDRSCQELTGKLVDDGYPREIAQDTCTALMQVGLVDDERFARAFAHLLVEVRGYGRARAQRELVARGISAELAHEALEEVTSPEDELARATALARALVAKTGPSVDRIASRLARKGFSASVALHAARRVADDSRPTEP